MPNCLPAYLRFIRGVIDSEDLPLEYLARDAAEQPATGADSESRDRAAWSANWKASSEKEPESFAKIWDAFGPVIKEGIWEDFERREKLLALSRFTTTVGEKRSLKQYAESLKPNQTEIYYLVGDSIERLKSNPKLESANARGIEVLLLTDPVDAFWTSAPLDFGGKPLKSLSQGDVDFGLIPLLDDKTDNEEPSGADEAATIAAIKDTLGDRVSDVRVSQRLTSSASCLVAGGQGRDRNWSDCWRSKIGASSPSRSSRSICAILSWRRLPVRKTRPRTCRFCCWSRRKSSTANCRRIPLHSQIGSISWCCAEYRRRPARQDRRCKYCIVIWTGLNLPCRANFAGFKAWNSNPSLGPNVSV